MSRTPGTREALLREGARLFAERGFGGTSVDEIGAASGISGPAIYKHFRSKNDLLAHLLVTTAERLLAGGRDAVARAGGDPGRALDGLIEAHVAIATAEADLLRIQGRDLRSLDEVRRRRVRRLGRSYVDLWAEVLCGMEPGLAMPVARLRAHAVFGLLESAHSVGSRQSAPERVEARRQLVSMARRAAVGPQARR